MDGRRGSLRELASLIYETPLSPEAWEPLTAGLIRTFHADACAVAVFDFRSYEGMFHVSAGYENQFVRSYQDQYDRHDVWLQHEEPYRMPGTVHLGQELVPDEDVIASEFYKGWLKPQDLLHRLSVVLVKEDANLCYFAVMRSPKSRAFGQQDVGACRLLAPHLRRAMQLGRRLALLETERDAAWEVLDRLPTGVLMCDEKGKPVLMNTACQDIVAARDGLVLQDRLLSTQRQGETHTLHRLIAGAIGTARGEGFESGGALSVDRPSGARPLSVLVSPLRIASDTLGHRRICAVVFVSNPDLDVETDETLLSRLYGLTRSESRLAVKLSKGKSVEEAAGALEITRETARTYTKRILSKTGARRQAELVRLLLLGPAHLTGRWSGLGSR